MQCACVQRLTLGGDRGREEHGQGRGEGSLRKGCHSCLQGEQEGQVDAQQRPLGLVLTTCLVWKQAGQREEGMREHTGVRGAGQISTRGRHRCSFHNTTFKGSKQGDFL